jgi:hypothetical protein
MAAALTRSHHDFALDGHLARLPNSLPGCIIDVQQVGSLAAKAAPPAMPGTLF